MKTRLYFLRHAEALGNIIREFHGWTDSPITEKGHIQAQKAAERISKLNIDVIYSSSLTRTLQTAQYVSDLTGIEIIKRDNLKEINGGLWEGRKWEDICRIWPLDYYNWDFRTHEHKMPEGESVRQFQDRLISEVESIVIDNPQKNILIVTHGTAIKALLCYFKGINLHQMTNLEWCDNTALTEVLYENGNYELIMESDASHLDDELSTLRSQLWWAEYQKYLSERRKEKEMDYNNIEAELLGKLFITSALAISPSDKPFWYTSGYIGPFYINTHYLYGSKHKAELLLGVIEKEKSDKLKLPKLLHDIMKDNYESDSIYKNVIDAIVYFINKNYNLDDIDYISGGERRDWYFSIIVAEILKKPHITIFKDMTMVESNGDEIREVEHLEGKNVLHINDLVNEASSIEKKWIPAIASVGGNLKYCFSVVDRNQGGRYLIEQNGIIYKNIINIDKQCFDIALEKKYIDDAQYKMVIDYIKNPRESMKKFLIDNPKFLENALKSSDIKERERANLLVKEDLYEINKR